MDDSIIIDLNGCARCRGEHPKLEFKPLTYPITTLSDNSITHWALCPTNGEPILLERVLESVLQTRNGHRKPG
jgi:hypothetical protein